MNKKVLSLLAASATALGSAMIGTPVRAQSAILPVEVEVTPRIFLRTYQNLKFVVSEQDLVGGNAVQQIGDYNEKLGTTSLPTTSPDEVPNTVVTKRVPVLYQIWGATTPQVEVTASEGTLTATSQDPFNDSTSTVTMAVTPGVLEDATNETGAAFKQASADFSFTFQDTNAASGTTFTDGEVTIRIVNP